MVCYVTRPPHVRYHHHHRKAGGTVPARKYVLLPFNAALPLPLPHLCPPTHYLYHGQSDPPPSKPPKKTDNRDDDNVEPPAEKKKCSSVWNIDGWMDYAPCAGRKKKVLVLQQPLFCFVWPQEKKRWHVCCCVVFSRFLFSFPLARISHDSLFRFRHTPSYMSGLVCEMSPPFRLLV